MKRKSPRTYQPYSPFPRSGEKYTKLCALNKQAIEKLVPIELLFLKDVNIRD